MSTTMTNVKERPVIFSAPMIRALLEGRKTMTRRIVKRQPLTDATGIHVGLGHPTKVRRDGEEYPGDEIYGAWDDEGRWGCPCPYGQPGDRLWVREAFQYNGCETDPDGSESWHIIYRADPQAEEHSGTGWKPSIHMPRWASRITLEVTGVRVERVQDITEYDAVAEGMDAKAAEWIVTAREQFEQLWGTINGPASWAESPWVWVVEFKRVEASR